LLLEVEDDALIRVFLRAAEFDASRPALPWVLGVVANECRTLRSKTQRRREGPFEDANARLISARPSAPTCRRRRSGNDWSGR
jgi:DNA-directed RNA polymerase specialized sigma24 family protein